MSIYDTYVNRNYTITMSFKMCGDVPLAFNQDQLKDKIKDLLGEVEIDSEIFDGEKEDYFWTLFPDGDIEIDAERIDVDFVHDIECEHCGQINDYFDARIYVNSSGIVWCYACGNNLLSDSHNKFIKKERKKFKKKLIKEKINSLKEDLKGLK
tara:strand:- start:295 stop:753 length:459 start_codon:yes stop_codon:yes gene_type:complete